MSAHYFKSDLVIRSLGVSWLKVVSAGLIFLNSIILARILGLMEYGRYSYVMSWIAVLIIPSLLGTPNLLVRNIAAYNAQKLWGRLRGIVKWTNRLVLASSLAVATIAGLTAYLISPDSGFKTLHVFLAALFLLPFSALAQHRQAAMQGLHSVVEGQIPLNLIRPTVFLILIYLLYLSYGRDLLAIDAIYVNIFSLIVAFLVLHFLLQKRIPRESLCAACEYDKGLWLRSSLPLLFISLMPVLNSNVGTILLGAMRGAEDVGVLTVTIRGSDLIAFFLVSFNMVLAPKISRLYSTNNMDQLQHLVTKVARMVLMLTLPLVLMFIFFGHWMLLLFGADFTKGLSALRILSMGQFVNALMGPVGILLVMTERENYAALGMGVSVILCAVLSVVLIPLYGIEGAAIASAISTVLWNLLLFVFVRQFLGINTTVFAKLKRGESP